MKVFNVDISAKHIYFELGEKKYSICFRDNMRKGVYDISVWVDGEKTNAQILGAYPPLKEVIKELWRIHFPWWLKSKIMKFLQLHNQ